MVISDSRYRGPSETLRRRRPVPSAVAREGDDHSADDHDDLWATVGPRPDDDRAAASAQARSRRRWLQQLATQSTTLAGVLLTLAERDAPVTVRCGPWTHRGRLRTVTAPLVILEGADGLALLATTGITVVEADAGVADDRVPGAGPDLGAWLASVVPERPAVRLQLMDGSEVTGHLEEMGKDVALVRLTSSRATVRLSAVLSCILLPHGDN
jgi:hypothetical protein